MWDDRDWTQFSCMQDKYLSCCTITPAPPDQWFLWEVVVGREKREGEVWRGLDWTLRHGKDSSLSKIDILIHRGEKDQDIQHHGQIAGLGYWGQEWKIWWWWYFSSRLVHGPLLYAKDCSKHHERNAKPNFYPIHISSEMHANKSTWKVFLIWKGRMEKSGERWSKASTNREKETLWFGVR